MRKCKQLVKSMIITIFLSLIIILLCEGEQFGNIRVFVVQKLKFFSGKRESVENIFIGIFGSSIVTLIGYILEYFQSIKILKKDVESCYMDIRYKLFPYIDGNNVKFIYKIRKDEILVKMREIAKDYKVILDFYLWLIDLINKFIKDDVYKLKLLDCNICSRYVKAAYVISVLTNHFLILNRNLLCRNVLLNEYKKEYKFLKNIVEKKELEKTLYPLKKSYKDFIQSDKEENEYIENLELNEACKNLDLLFVFGVSE